jgi:hypothetical protein
MGLRPMLRWQRRRKCSLLIEVIFANSFSDHWRERSRRTTFQRVRRRFSPGEVAADPRWRELADTTPDYNDPETLAQSEAAERLPEPDSLVPEKSLTALETAAADAEEVWRKLEPTLTEDERKAINDAFANQQIDKDTKARMIVDGVTCLMGAIA